MNKMLLTTLTGVLISLAAACGDLSDGRLQSADVLLAGTVVQTIDISNTGNNTFSESVDPASTFALNYDEPMDLTTAREHITIVNADDQDVSVTVSQRLETFVITPDAELPANGGNYTLQVERGIDDASGNTSDLFYNIVFFVE